jgi:hypothetical protein
MILLHIFQGRLVYYTSGWMINPKYEKPLWLFSHGEEKYNLNGLFTYGG